MENLELTHINEQGRACMVDVTQKDVTFRQAEAEGRVRVNSETLALIRTGGTPKGASARSTSPRATTSATLLSGSNL